MKIALVHDMISEFGGTERILEVLSKLYPSADIFTSYANPSILKFFLKHVPPHRFKYSFVQNTPLMNHNNLLQAISPLIWRSFNLENYDLVISNSYFLLCNQIAFKKTVHIQYVCCPPKNIFGLVSENLLQKFIPFTPIIYQIYQKAIKSTPYIIVCSKYIQKVMNLRFQIQSKIIYPPVKIPKLIPAKNKKKYFLIISRLDRSKNIELAIEACNILKLPLKIIGRSNEPKYELYLKEIAGPTIEFLGLKTDNEIEEIYKYAKAFLFTAKSEDFGIAPIESLAHGVPVIAYYGGGVKESLIDNITGFYFYEHRSKSLVKAIRKFFTVTFSSYKLHNHAKKFSEDKFRKEINHYVNWVSLQNK